jgi:hypothetical protein
MHRNRSHEVEEQTSHVHKDVQLQLQAAGARPAQRGCGGQEATAEAEKKKHIYLVIEDWEMGYSIHKLDIDDLGL